MKSLMELVGKCEVTQGKVKDNNEVIDRALELEELGFKDVADKLIKKIELAEKLKKVIKYKYIKITEANIKEYLYGKVTRYNEKHKKEERANDYPNTWYGHVDAGVSFNGVSMSHSYGYTFTATNIPKHQTEILAEPTNDYYSNNEKTIGKFIWTETPLEQYEAIPPQPVLETLKVNQDRHVFDYFTIAKVNEMVDPLLLGRIESVTDRFFLCQWGSDIKIDDLI